MFDVASAFVCIVGGGTGLCGGEDDIGQVIDGDLSAVACIVGAVHLLVHGGEDESAHDVFHVDEITCLLAVTKDGDVFSLHCFFVVCQNDYPVLVATVLCLLHCFVVPALLSHSFSWSLVFSCAL